VNRVIEGLRRRLRRPRRRGALLSRLFFFSQGEGKRSLLAAHLRSVRMRALLVLPVNLVLLRRHLLRCPLRRQRLRSENPPVLATGIKESIESSQVSESPNLVSSPTKKQIVFSPLYRVFVYVAPFWNYWWRNTISHYSKPVRYNRTNHVILEHIQTILDSDSIKFNAKFASYWRLCFACFSCTLVAYDCISCIRGPNSAGLILTYKPCN
jgi:hypothetical protein